MKNLQVKIYRGSAVESEHRIHAAIVDSSGKTLQSYGNPKLLTYTRSAIKPLQALVAVSSDSHQELTSQEIALACSSHMGESFHTEAITHWLSKLQLKDKHLLCGRHWPYNQESSFELVRENEEPTNIHNNCSGKHSGFLFACQKNHWPLENYNLATHPLQKSIMKILSDFSGTPITDQSLATDGCNIPTFLMSIENVARAMAHLADYKKLTPEFSHAAERIFKACREFPQYISGTGEYCTEIVKELQSPALIKIGAEGVMAASLPDKKLGIYIKAEDGAKRAAEAALSFILVELGVLSPSSSFLRPQIKNRKDISVGYIEAMLSTKKHKQSTV